MDKKNFALGKENFIIMAISIVIIIIGFCLMVGGTTTEESGFNPAIFSTRRIIIAPAITSAGFMLVVWAILYKKKEKQ